LAYELIELLSKGAEAEIWKGKWLDLEAVFKVRKSKPWRHPRLDKMILETRTVKEAKIMYDAFNAGIDVPYIFDIDLQRYTIVMEYVRGVTLKNVLNKKEDKVYELCEELGKIAAKLHMRSIVHGDLTPANVIIRENGKLCLIDFGLANFSNRIEDMGVDLHLFLRALESSFALIAEKCFDSFVRGYAIMDGYKAVLEKVKEIRRRGRYVLERRLVAKL